MPEDLGDRTELPTSRRRREARGRGQIAKSQDLGSAIELTGGFVAVLLLGGGILAGATGLLRAVLDDRVTGAAFDGDGAAIDGVLRFAFTRLVLLAGPFLLAMFITTLVGQLLQVGWAPSLAPIQPRLDRLNPLSGFARLFSRRNGVKTGVGLVKLALTGFVGVAIIRSHMPEIAALPRLVAAAAFMMMGRIVADLCLWMLAVMLLIGLADYLYQRWQQTKDLKMTRQEVKDEMRSMEGDMETKGRRLRMARQIALQRIRSAVPKADVIVTNPTHYAVALQYESGTMSAPRVVAKGADFLAFRIREIAAASGIPIVEKPPLARALYAEAAIGKPISPEFYEAVAEILAYVYRLEGRMPVAA